jgi:hypothetical protein
MSGGREGGEGGDEDGWGEFVGLYLVQGRFNFRRIQMPAITMTMPRMMMV